MRARVFSTLLAGIACATAVGGLVIWRSLPTPVVIPPALLADPMLAEELSGLAAAAEAGGQPEWMAFGDALLGQGAYRAAEAAYRRAAALNPDDIEARFAVAFCIDRTGRMEESNEHYRACLELPEPPGVQQSKKPFARYAIGRNLLRLEDEVGAEAAFRQNPGFPPAEYQLARILLFSGRPREAEVIVRRGLESLPLSLEWHRLHGRILDALGRPAEAAVAREMEERSAHLLEVNFNVDYIGPLTEKVGLNRLLADYEAARQTADAADLDQRLRQIEAAIGDRLIPERFLAAQLRAELALTMAKPEVALKVIEAAEQLGGAGPQLLQLKAAAWEQLGRLDEATRLRERLVAISPSPELFQLLAEARSAAGDATGQQQFLARRERLEGLAAYRRNDPEEALPHFEEATRLDPADGVSWYHRGEMLFHLNRKPEAAEALKQALTVNPGDGRSRRLLAITAE